jgi:hypothetical protein
MILNIPLGGWALIVLGIIVGLFAFAIIDKIRSGG